MQLGGMTYNELKLQVDTNHNLLYCDLPKCGSSVWQKQMMKEMALFCWFLRWTEIFDEKPTTAATRNT